MAERARPIRSESAWFYVDGVRRGKGIVMVCPDRLVSVKLHVEIWFWFICTVLLGLVLYPVIPSYEGFVAPFFGIMLGQLIGRAVERNMAARVVADGGHDAQAIPLDMISSLRTDRSGGLAGLFVTETLVVTTADGTEYGFRGRTGHVQDDIAGALAGLGREVRATPLGLEVRQAVGNGS